MKHEYIIKNGKILDGSGNPWFQADIGGKKDKIVKIGKIKENSGHRVLDAERLVVAPGFIDVHSHDDLIFFKDQFNTPKLLQGVTTVVIGNCGTSPAPVQEDRLSTLKSYIGILAKEVEFTWRSYGEFLKTIEELGRLGTNTAGLVGHGTLRIAVMGVEERKSFIQKVCWTNILVTYSEGFEQFENMNLKDIAEDWNKTPYDALFDILAEDGTKADMVLFMMNEEEVERVLSHPHVMVGTDGLEKGVGSPHPRAYGTFPRVLGRYVREKGLIRIEEAVRKMTSLPAQRLGINDRGTLREGMYADMVIFDPQKAIDNATYACLRLKPVDIE